MKAVGIIAEYNPLHNGHIYHIKQAKEIAGSDAAVIAMSGDFVQRGEPAILDKWTRTRHALLSGADLVIEIPVYYCLGNAGQYAFSGTRILRSTGMVSHIAFGSESGDAEALGRTALFLKEHEEEIAERVRFLRSSGLSYPAARSKVYSDLRGIYSNGCSGKDIQAELDIMSQPNDILGLEYMKYAGSMKPLPVRRLGAGYHDMVFNAISACRDGTPEYLSASAIREHARSGRGDPETGRDLLSDYVPACTAEDIKNGTLTFADDWIKAVRYACLSSAPDDLDDCPSGGEGLGNLLISASADACTFDELIRTVKSRRYTYSRISRLCMQAVLGIRRSDYIDASPDYIRVLGMNDTGRKLLSEMKKEGSADVPVITNINKEHLPDGSRGTSLLRLDVHAADIYNLMTGRNVAACSDHRMMPVII